VRHLRNLTLVVLPLSVLACSRDARPTAGLDWAYPQGNATTFGRPLGQGPVSVPGSALVLTRAQMSAAEGPIDWFPQDHPPAPAVIGGQPGKVGGSGISRAVISVTLGAGVRLAGRVARRLYYRAGECVPLRR